ncbi:hypothetical protein SteCoe_4032 [Stentor coeruleus]|uniref:Palmitoyltransferase n=1 Tax=Stentor coeruleus TaxID=5963 RepID=A0A1R2CVQ2_9CILI|nr:hypothetical protein SteCoe_4032 [Stentor coeruleus]
MKKNGFSRPFDKYQILTWILFTILASSFYFVYIPLTPSQLFPIISIPYTLSSCLVCYFTFRVCSCNPADPSLLSDTKTLTKSSKTCTVCKSDVFLSSKHCGSCDKCISGFDHHCRALNTCIGFKNYLNFFRLLKCVEIWLLLQLVTELYCLTKISELFQAKCGLLIFLLIEGILILVLLLANGGLLIFHCWLKKNSISTYDFVVKKYYRSVAPSMGDGKKSEERYIIKSSNTPIGHPYSVSQDQLTNL